MRQSQLRPLTALAAALAIWAMVGVAGSSAQPNAASSGEPPGTASSTQANAQAQRYVTNLPPSATSTEPPSARRVRSGWATDTRGRIRAPTKAIQCGQLLDVRERRIRRDVTILIEGERITEIRDGAVRPRNADAVINLRDQVCAPGLMDMHLHLTATFLRQGETDRPQNPFHYTVSELAIGLANARETLYSGVTTIRSPGEYLPNRGAMYMREAFDKWEHPGPRMFVASDQIGYDYARATVVRAGDGYYERRRPHLLSYDTTVPGGDVRQGVRNALAHGEEWIKLSLDVGGDLSFGMPHTRLWSLEEMRAMADEAHRLGARITAHIESDETARDAVLAGFDSIEHAYAPSRATLDLMKAHNVYWSTTLVDLTMGHDATDPRLGSEQPLSRGRDTSALMRRRDEAFRYAYSIGVPIVWASDGWFGPSQHRGRMVLEFSMYRALGVTPWDLLTFATLNPAAMLGQSDNLGSIDPGKYADIIAFPSNPLEDVSTYGRVNFVMKGGNVVRDDLHRNPLRDVYVMRLPNVAYTVADPHAPLTFENLTCTGSDC